MKKVSRDVIILSVITLLIFFILCPFVFPPLISSLFTFFSLYIIAFVSHSNKKFVVSIAALTACTAMIANVIVVACVDYSSLIVIIAIIASLSTVSFIIALAVDCINEIKLPKRKFLLFVSLGGEFTIILTCIILLV